jgi:hypothetical protein
MYADTRVVMQLAGKGNVLHTIVAEKLQKKRSLRKPKTH